MFGKKAKQIKELKAQVAELQVALVEADEINAELSTNVLAGSERIAGMVDGFDSVAAAYELSANAQAEGLGKIARAISALAHATEKGSRATVGWFEQSKQDS